MTKNTNKKFSTIIEVKNYFDEFQAKLDAEHDFYSDSFFFNWPLPPVSGAF